MKTIVSLFTAIGMLFAGIYAFFANPGGGTETPPPETQAPPIAASAGQSYIPPAMPAGPHEAQSIVVSYNLSGVLEMPSTFRGCWGGQQSRIARQGDDLYVIYGIHSDAYGWNDYAGGENEFNLYRYSAARDEWTYFYTLRSYAIPGIHAAQDGNVYVAYVHARGLGILKYDPGTDKMSMHDSGFHFPQINDKDHWSYMNTGISQGRYIWFLGNSNTGNHGTPGAFGIYSYDTLTGKFDFGSQPRHVIDHRHCYEYVLDNRDGGITIAGMRDIFWDASEWDQRDDEFGAIFDEVNFWTYKDNKLSDIRRVVKASQGKTITRPSVAINHAGDAYLDSEGYLHIMYYIYGAETQGRAWQEYAVYMDGAEVQKEALFERSHYSVSFIEDTAGQRYLLALSTNLRDLSIFHVNMVGGTFEVTLSKTIRIPNINSEGGSFAGISLTAPRSGSTPADYVDVIYPHANQLGWNYFRLQLR